MTTRAIREQQGRRAETFAAWYLRLHGYRILARRVKCARGEIDLVARRGRTVVFVEVKWRRNVAGLDLAIDALRMRRVVAAVQMVGHHYARAGDDMRIDALLLAPRRWPRHLRNITQL